MYVFGGVYLICYFIALREMMYVHYDAIKKGVWDRNFLSLRYEETLFKFVIIAAAFLGALMVPFTVVKRMRKVYA